MQAHLRQIERYSLNCPILLSSLDKDASSTSQLSLTKNLSAKGAYVSGTAQWSKRSELLASVYYEISLFARQQVESRFLIRFVAHPVRCDEGGFALEFSATDMILPLSMTCAMTPQEAEVAANIDFFWRL
ncbi:hypothetical protein SAMN02745165_01989 [Malonomonas rubra DSM 5091]|uniref:PilZ domain-containing protein n=1 Tax=Malonomonas rubra DSM 5091 TaxID=1122189 RepID=A0A1M6I304_MALRU|nr:hypothetical protein [Malonomonas rubra]SHJ28800.1 hypothetical protein SAMN02745165_01989 [Malonomonas rubra DSM 5091]